MSIFDDESDRSGYDRLANRVIRGMRGGAGGSSSTRTSRSTPSQQAGHDALKRKIAMEFKRSGRAVPAELVCYVTPGGKRACFVPKGKPKKKGKGKTKGRR